MFYKNEKAFLKILENLQENRCVGACFDKVAGVGHVTLLKKRLRHRFFPVNLRTPILWSSSERLLLIIKFINNLSLYPRSVFSKFDIKD